MSTHFYGYRFPKRDLWKVVDTLRSYFAADHRYALAAQMVEIAHYRRLSSGKLHSDACATVYLGECDCDFWTGLETVRNFVTSKQRDVDGLEGQFVEYGHDYVMLIRGDYNWTENIPDALLGYLGMRRVNYNNSTNVLPVDRPNRKIVDRFEDAIKSKRYFMVPLLTVYDVHSIQWQLARFFGPISRKKREDQEASEAA